MFFRKKNSPRDRTRNQPRQLSVARQRESAKVQSTQVSRGWKTGPDWQKTNAAHEGITFGCLLLCRMPNMGFGRQAFCPAAVPPTFRSARSVCLQDADQNEAAQDHA